MAAVTDASSTAPSRRINLIKGPRWTEAGVPEATAGRAGPPVLYWSEQSDCGSGFNKCCCRAHGRSFPPQLHIRKCTSLPRTPITILI